MDKKTLKQILIFQRNEITEFHIYSRLAYGIKDAGNKKVLKNIANEELKHYSQWSKYTGKELKPDRWAVFKYYWISKLFGLTFGIKLMENGEGKAQVSYQKLVSKFPFVSKIINEERKHEEKLISLIEEERLLYIGAVVLGLNDALVELTGALAGLTLALQNVKLIALAGLVTGVAAAFSMAASAYLSARADDKHANAFKSSIYTGVTYIITVILLIMPYLLIGNYILCLAITVCIAVFIIYIFNFYIAVAKNLDFKKRFFEMAAISLGVASFSFILGYVIKIFLGVQI